MVSDEGYRKVTAIGDCPAVLSPCSLALHFVTMEPASNRAVEKGAAGSYSQ